MNEENIIHRFSIITLLIHCGIPRLSETKTSPFDDVITCKMCLEVMVRDKKLTQEKKEKE